MAITTLNPHTAFAAPALRFGKSTPAAADAKPAQSQHIRELLPELVDRVDVLTKAVTKNPEDLKSQQALGQHVDNIFKLLNLSDRLRRMELTSVVGDQVDALNEEWLSPIFTRLGITVKNENSRN